MDILIYCNGLHTRTYLNAKITRDNKEVFDVTYGSDKTVTITFDKEVYNFKEM